MGFILRIRLFVTLIARGLVLVEQEQLAAQVLPLRGVHERVQLRVLQRDAVLGASGGIAALQPKHLDPDTIDVNELKQRFLVVQAVEVALLVSC